jgi:VWFA-related protein
MRQAPAFLLSACLLAGGLVGASAQTRAPQTARPQQPSQQDDDEVVRITSALVQTDVVVTDKNDRIVEDLKLSDFEVTENGKRQELKFLEFVNVAGERRTEGSLPGGALPETARIERELTPREVRRVMAFVIDDLTIPGQDVLTVRQMLTDFVENKMERGDLVAIVRTVGGKGLLQQFTSDKRVLRRAIAQINAASMNYGAFGEPEPQGVTKGDLMVFGGTYGDTQFEAMEINDLSRATIEDTTRTTRALVGLLTANSVIDSLREIPGRKSLVLVSGGIPVLSASTIDSSGTPIGVIAGQGGGMQSAVQQVTNRLRDNAVRSGVVINTMDPRGLTAQRGVASVNAVPGRSAMDAPDPGFGRGASQQELAIMGQPLSAGSEQLSLRTLAADTGGVAAINTNDFRGALDRVLAHSRGYYVLAYSPAEKFDNKYRKIDVKVKRDGVRVYKHSGYVAREDAGRTAPRTKREEVLAAARSPLAKTELDVSSNLSLRMTPPKGADLGINLLIDPKTLNFTQADGKRTTTFDVVGFVVDEMGRTRGGFSETVTASLTEEKYQEAVMTGLTYSAGTQLPPGFYQLKVVVREEASGNVGTVTRYVEVPDLTKGRLTMSSIFLHAVDPGAGASPVPLTALRRLQRKQDLRYSAIVYNARQEAGKPQLRVQTIISRDDKVIFRGQEQPAVVRGGDAAQSVLVEQIGLPKAAAGHYVLTFIVIDPLADKKFQTTMRSIDFYLVD